MEINRNTWIGGRREKDNVDKEFQWIDGTKVDYESILKNVDTSTYSCVIQQSYTVENNYRWLYEECDSTFFVLCAKDIST